ncbi:DUF4365 domain-containing protein [Hyphomicrobium sp.]|uniref:DUF4365 domain-containing protein n=1 Tax=Hyphomicrobium sp. TaxID=82 RepID=UPI001E064F19|nr:DUF4365 domain-containing protein [Hyphomicrobium sp.]MBY0561007.1 DUF4365 domain-containing protein [Hyphomicrobium sp.]
MSKKSLSERVGLNAVERIFLEEFEWFFREKPILDWGIDAEVEVVEDSKPTGKLIALQIKSGSSYFKKKGSDYVYYGEMRHLEYWSQHCLPVYIILHDEDTGLTLWQKIDRPLCEEHKKGWSIKIPATNVLNKDAKPFIEAGLPENEEGARRLRFALDIDLMEKIGDGPVTIIWQDWVNKGLGLRNPKIYLGDYDRTFDDREPDMEFPMCWIPGHDVGFVMSLLMPWLEYIYGEEVESDAEVEEHVLLGKLTGAAKGYLAAERFFKNGPDQKTPELPRRGFGDDPEDEDLIRERQEWWENMRDVDVSKEPIDDTF